jgi:FtsZ-interacting cell division protein YlmF
MSGIAFALNGKITPVSAKTYFITPENVDLLDAQSPSGNPSDQE